MAIAVQSVSTKSYEADNTLTITKPSGTVDGDFLLAFVMNEGGQTVSTVPSGWTLLQEDFEDGGDAIRVYWKEASSEGASWDWVFSASTEHMGGAIRIDGQIPTNPTDQDNEAAVVNDRTPSYANGITPTYEDSLLVMAIVLNDGANLSTTSFAIATDNPTWTERINLFEGTIGAGLLVGTAIRPEKTATGNSSATLGSSGTPDSACILFSISPQLNVTVSPAVVDLTASVQAPTVTGSAVVSPAVVDATASVQAPTVTTQNSKWTNKDKSATSSVTNKDKS